MIIKRDNYIIKELIIRTNIKKIIKIDSKTTVK